MSRLVDNPTMFVVGFEANPALYTMFEMNPGINFDSTVHAANPDTEKKRLVYRHHNDRALLVLGAVADDLTEKYVEFHPGLGFTNKNGHPSDVGSLMKITAEQEAKDSDIVVVRKIRLEQVLKHIPPPHPGYVWDTLKVDIQGYDVEALYSAGPLLSYFTCVVGEFILGKYEASNNLRINPNIVLEKAG